MQIPIFQQSQVLQPSAPVEAINPTQASQAGRGLAEFGDQAFKFASAVRDVDNTLEAEKRATAASNDFNSLREDVISQGAADGSDFADKFQQGASDIQEKYLSDITDPQLQLRVSRELKRQQMAGMSVIQDQAFKSKIQDTQQKSVDIQDMKANQVLTNPDLASMTLADYRDNVIKPMEGTIPQENLNKLYSQAQEKFAMAQVNGLLDQKRYGAVRTMLGASEQDDTLALTPDQLGNYGLKSDGNMKLPMTIKDGAMGPDQSEVLRGLTPQMKERFIDQANAMAERDSHVKLSTVNMNLQAYVGYSLQGQDIPPDQANKVRQLVASLPPDLRDQYAAKMNEADKLRPIMQMAANGTPQQTQALLDRLDASLGQPTDLAQKYAADSIRQQAISGINAIQKQRNQDPVASALNSNQDLMTARKAMADGDPQATQQYIATALATQGSLGVQHDKQRVLTNSDVSGIANQLTGAQANGADVLAQNLNKLSSQYGPYFPQVIQEVASKDKSISPSMVLAAQVSDPNAQKEMLDNISRKNEINKLFSQLPKGQTKDIAPMVNDEMQAFSAVMAANSTNAQALANQSALNDQVITQAKKNVVMRQMSPSDAVSQAYNTIIKNNFDFVQDGRSNVLIPRSANYSSDKVSQFVKDYEPAPSFTNDYRWATDLGIEPSPAAYQAAQASNPGASQSDMRNAYRQALAKTARWMSTPDQTGVQLVADSPSGKPKQVYRANGTPVQFSFKDLANYTGPQTFAGKR